MARPTPVAFGDAWPVSRDGDRRVTRSLSTHDAGGMTGKDFDLARCLRAPI
jgi:pterin-4a-carbinolamine dehydratase